MTGWLIVAFMIGMFVSGIVLDLRRFRKEDRVRPSCEGCGTRTEPLRPSRYWHDEGVALLVCASCEEDGFQLDAYSRTGSVPARWGTDDASS